MLARRWLINLGLFAVAVALALAARWGHDRAVPTTALTAIAAEDIESLSLRRPGEPPIRLVRDGDGSWRMLEPVAAHGAGEAIGKLLPIAASVVHRAIPTGAVDLQQLGLEPPRIRLSLDGLELRFGTTEPIDDRRYVQIGEMVYLIDDRYLPLLLASAERYLSRRLLPADFSPILGTIDGRPLGAGAVAGLVDVQAKSVEPLTGPLGGRLLSLKSADGGKGLRFLVDQRGTRWSRVDQRLSYSFVKPPLAELEEDPIDALSPAVAQPGLLGLASPAEPFAPRVEPGPGQAGFAPRSDEELLQLRAPSQPNALQLLPKSPPAPAPARMPTEKLTP